MGEYYESVPSGAQHPLPLGRRPLATAAWCGASLLVAFGIYSAARLGVRVAEERVPPASVRPSPVHTVGERLTINGTIAKPLVLAFEPQQLREYRFRESSIPGTGLEGISDGSVFEHRGSLDIEVLESDLDLLRVRIVAGPRVGGAFWIESLSVGSGSASDKAGRLDADDDLPRNFPIGEQ